MIENNNKNAVYIKLRLNPADPHLPAKEKLIGSSRGTLIKTFKYFENYKDNQKTNDKYMSYLRYVEYDGDLNAISEYLVPPVEDVRTCRGMRRKLRLAPVSVENEKKALGKLKLIAEKCLSKYPQTYEEDLKLLQNKLLTFNQRNCIVLRSGEKKVPCCHRTI